MSKKYPSVVAKPGNQSDPFIAEFEYNTQPNRFKQTYVQDQKQQMEDSRVPRGDGTTISDPFRTDAWTNVLTGLGVCGRDKKTAGYFAPDNIFNRSELDFMYRSDGVLKLVIDLFAQEMVRQGWEIEGDTDGKVIAKLEELKAAEAMCNLCKWARLYGGAICIMGIADGLPLDAPVEEDAIRDIQWLRVFDRFQAYSRDGTFESDLNSPNYGYPNVYTVNDNRTGAVFFVHYSRILRMDWNVLPPRWQNYNQGWGDPLVQTIYQELRNYSTAFSNTATIFEDFVNTVLTIPGLTNAIASSGGSQNIMNRLNILNLCKSNLNTAIVDGEETYEKLSTNVAGIHELLDRFMIALSAVTRIPVSLLFGRSPAGFQATGDNEIRNFYDAVKQDQEVKLKPVLEKLIRYIMISKDGPFNGVELDNWSVQFVPLWQNSEEQEAIVRKLVAETDSMYIDRGVLMPAEVAISRFGGSKYSSETEIDVKTREPMEGDPEELETLQEEKNANETVNPTTGPDILGEGVRNYRSKY